jgi:hypothetical protein
MHSIAVAIAKAGILSPETLQEFRRWGLPLENLPTEKITDPAVLSHAIEEALQDEGLVLTRETDLGVVQQYLQTMKRGHLHVVIDDDDGRIEETDIEVFFGTTTMGEYILRWYSEGITDVLTNGKTYLRTYGPLEDVNQVYFRAVRELFFGDQKVFMLCEPAKTLMVHPIFGAQSVFPPKETTNDSPE